MDVMMIIYNAMIADEYINIEAKGRIKFYQYPATGDVVNPYIVIDPLGPPLPTDYADDDALTDDYIYQIDVWTKNRTKTKELAKRVSKVMRSLGFGNISGGVDEYDQPSGIYRDARRYRGKRYSDEYNKK